MEKEPKGWLVIQRLPFESIMIGQSIEIAISKVKGRYVSVAVRAPAHLKIVRKEKLSAVERTEIILSDEEP